MAKAQTESRKNKEPHFANLNEDNMLSGVVVHFLGASETTIGRKDATPRTHNYPQWFEVRNLELECFSSLCPKEI